MCRDLILVCLVRIPYYRNLDKSAETRIVLSDVLINSYFLRITAVQPEI